MTWGKEIDESVKEKIKILVDSLDHPKTMSVWNAWEMEFIESMGEKIDGNWISIHLTPKQIEKVESLFEKL